MTIRNDVNGGDASATAPSEMEMSDRASPLLPDATAGDDRDILSRPSGDAPLHPPGTLPSLPSLATAKSSDGGLNPLHPGHSPPENPQRQGDRPNAENGEPPRPSSPPPLPAISSGVPGPTRWSQQPAGAEFDPLDPRMSLSFDTPGVEASNDGGSGQYHCEAGGNFAYCPPRCDDMIAPASPTRSCLSDGNESICSLEEVRVYDKHGQRAPYYDGPYLISCTPDGQTKRSRWYGRLEDGYIAWVSINLFEHFGAIVYQPLNPREMKQGKVPEWMYNIFSLPNLAIPMSYFCIGIALQLLRTPLIVYFINDLEASAAEVNVLYTVMALPWCFKMMYGFLSDCVPISGLRRKPYFMTGWLVYVISNLILCFTPNPSIQMCIFLVFTQTAGYMLADVMTDALIVERSAYESLENRGQMQSKGYIVRFLGSVIGAIIGAVVYNRDEWKYWLPISLVFFINAAIPAIFLIPLVPFLMEIETECLPRNFFEQCRELFHTAQLKAVWQPMTFVYVYNAMQLTNAAWMNFLVEGLEFKAWMIGIVGVVGSIMSWFGIMTYEKFFFGSNWRIVYFWCTSIASAIAVAQIVLVTGVNRRFGLSDIAFSMGDDVLIEFVIAVQFLPMCIMYLGLCPEGSEGTTYAMLTTWSNLAGTIAFDISTALTGVWDVSSEAIQAGDYSGVGKLSLFCGIVGPLPLVLLGLIPKNKEDQQKLQADNTRSYTGGVIFISVMILSLLVTFAESIYEICFNDESDKEANQRRLRRLMVGH
mmetsp:Transcript_13840/g.27597  ORF Transcript_13840/g.27597 Transcript_13840/m.27597 type:complete len:760 (+) Transcript_13840:90-2369(+)|eukprot:CAMPEP_0194330448 /NCGR_PEP_ID=MMETSP0171-20130528/52042_1 /TAXON_ID=218684 /ORGANISM="Corethron pennatum, Strain L29A3" /LENGTH=759 /DNA_ID=CAMNT_0039091553 /DNA_START=77 /DNA_END=2356 /DNA_ORIENTATION=+